MVGHAGVGRQQRPEGAELAGVVLFAQRWAEAPEGQQGARPIDSVALGVAVQHQCGEMGEAARLEVFNVGLAQVFQVEFGAAQRVDQHRLLRPTHLRPIGDLQRQLLALAGRHCNFLQWPLRPIRRCGPPVGAPHAVVDVGRDAVFEERGVQHVGVVGIKIGRVQAAVAQQAVQHLGGAALMAGRVTQQYQRLLGRVMQAGMQLGLPEQVCGHGGWAQAVARCKSAASSRY